jgi:predicted nucleic acid-binding protein
LRSNVPNAYLDASALVKLVVAEAETPDLRRALDPVDAIYTSELAPVEVARAVRRVAGDDRGFDKAEQVLGGCIQIELDESIKRSAARSLTALATLDAIHLESALSLRALLDEFVTYDHRLATAARNAGLDVRSPGSTA